MFEESPEYHGLFKQVHSAKKLVKKVYTEKICLSMAFQ